MKQKLFFLFPVFILAMLWVPRLQAQQVYELTGDSVRVFWNGRFQTISEDGNYPFYNYGGDGVTGAADSSIAFTIQFYNGLISVDTMAELGSVFSLGDIEFIFNGDTNVYNQETRRATLNADGVTSGGYYVLYAIVDYYIRDMMPNVETEEYEKVYACETFVAPDGVTYYESGLVNYVDLTGEPITIDLVMLPATYAEDETEYFSDVYQYTYMVGSRTYTLDIHNDTVINRQIINEMEDGSAICSILPLHLIPNAGTTTSETIYACEYFYANGEYFYASGPISFIDESGEPISADLVILTPTNTEVDMVTEYASDSFYVFMDVVGVSMSRMYEQKSWIYSDTILRRHTITIDDSVNGAICMVQDVAIRMQEQQVDDPVYGCGSYTAPDGQIHYESGRIRYTSDGEVFPLDLVIFQPRILDSMETRYLDAYPYSYWDEGTNVEVVISADTTLVVTQFVYDETAGRPVGCTGQYVSFILNGQQPQDSTSVDCEATYDSREFMACNAFTYNGISYYYNAQQEVQYIPDTTQHSDDNCFNYAMHKLILFEVKTIADTDYVSQTMPYTYVDRGGQSHTLTESGFAYVYYGILDSNDIRNESGRNCRVVPTMVTIVNAADTTEPECENTFIDTMLTGCGFVFYNDQYYQYSGNYYDTTYHASDICYDITNIRVVINPTGQGYDTVVSYGPYTEMVDGSVVEYSQTTDIRRRGTNI
ncbi:MAG: hypothetical protein IJ620_03295, partial [Bacteroidales bacterium]|nr:hypothetical protein [Bacteroidales bacterium]